MLLPLSSRLRLFLLLFVGLLAGITRAQTFPLTLDRVTAGTPIRPGTLYVLAATEKEEGRYIALSAQAATNKRLKGLHAAVADEDQLTVNKAVCLWRFTPADDGSWRLQSVDTDTYLTRSSNNQAGITLQSTPSTNNAWIVNDNGDGTFTLTAGQGATRSLGMSSSYTAGRWSYTFDHYAGDRHLLIYGYGLKLTDSKGNQTVPPAGTHRALCDGGRVAGNDGQSLDATDALLADGTLAPAEGLAVWVSETDGSDRFALRGSAGYLGYNLQPSATPVWWQVVRGHLASCESEARYLCYDTAGRRWLLKSDDEAIAGEGAHLISVADEPHSQLDEAGVCRLTGGWSATALSKLSWEGINCLDLTALVLPRQQLPFTDAPQEANIPIFVTAGSADEVPESWRFAVMVSGDKARLLRPTELTDRQPFFTNRPFTVTTGQLTYQRTAPQADGWQTLCLPFDVQAPSGLLAISDATEGDQPAFTYTTTLRAGVPGLVRCYMGQSMTVTCEAGTIAASPESAPAHGLAGTFTPWTVDEQSANLYLLSATKGCFVRAAAGSSLPPFRAALLWTGGAQSPSRTLNLRILSK